MTTDGPAPDARAAPALVTGASGFAGSHLVEYLAAAGRSVAGWGNPAGHGIPAGDDERVQWTAVDVTDGPQVAAALAALRPSAVFHCAGIADVKSSWGDSSRALRVNALGTHHILRGLEAAGLDVPVLVTGSALVYRPSTGRLTEDSPIGPATPYGVSKLAQEMIAGEARGRILLTRPFNHAGPRQSDAYVTSSFARQIAEAEAGLREPVLRVGNLDARRDITDVRDTVRAYAMLLASGRSQHPYNVCSGRAHRIHDVMEALMALSTVPIRVEMDRTRLRPSDTPVVLGSFERLNADTGWEPRIPLERTLGDLLEYWRAAVRARRAEG